MVVSWLLLANSSVVKMMSSLRCCWPRSRVDVGARASSDSFGVPGQAAAAFCSCRGLRSRWCQLIMVHECVTRCVERCVDARWRSPRRQRQLAACKTLGNRHRIFVCGGVFRRAVRSVDGVGKRRTGSTTERLESAAQQGERAAQRDQRCRARSRSSPAAARRRRARPVARTLPRSARAQTLPHPWAREGK